MIVCVSIDSLLSATSISIGTTFSARDLLIYVYMPTKMAIAITNIQMFLILFIMNLFFNMFILRFSLNFYIFSCFLLFPFLYVFAYFYSLYLYHNHSFFSTIFAVFLQFLCIKKSAISSTFHNRFFYYIGYPLVRFLCLFKFLKVHPKNLKVK